MGVASSSVVSPTTRSRALMVRLAPYLVEAVCELTRALKDKTHAQTEISGLLFGSSQDGTITVEALKTFKDSSGPRSDLARRERMEKAFTAAMALANEDPEFSAYHLLGWFSLRGGGGLINSDVEFHNRHFKTNEEIALIVWREGDTQITTELYAPVEGGKLSAEDYRWSSVRLSTELRHVSQPLDLVMRVRMSDDLYLRTYGGSDGGERKEEWKKIADNAKRAILSFLPGRGRSEIVYPDDLPLPPPSGSAKRSFESQTVFRGTEAETLPAAVPATQMTPAKLEAVRTSPLGPAAESVPFDFNRAPRPKPVQEVSGLPAVISKKPPAAAQKTPWLSMVLVCLAFSGLTFAFLAFKAAGSGDGRLGQVMKVLFPGSDLDLHAASHGDSLWITWNRRNPTVAGSSGAVLAVNDGPRHFERKLDPGQVADGEVRYTPVSGDVTFELTVYGPDQSIARASLRVVDATSPVGSDPKPALDLNAASAPPTAPTTAQKESNPSVPAPAPARVVEQSSSNQETTTPPSLPAAGANTTQPTATTTTKLNLEPPSKPIQETQSQTAVTPSPAPTVPQQTVAQTPKPPAPRPLPPVSNSNPTPPTSNTAIGEWDTNADKPAAPVQAPSTQGAPLPDSKTVAFVGPKVLLQVMPSTRNLAPGIITEVTRVEVKVYIDVNGRVTRAVLTNPNVKSQLGAAATAAAKQWTFQPATMNGQKVASDHTIAFDFKPEGQ